MADENKKLKILVVEDEEGARNAIVGILAKSGLDAVGAADCPEALAIFDGEGGFDLVLTDLTLPGPSGWDVSRAVKERAPDMPVVLMSGWDIDGKDEEITKSGISRVLTKPVAMKDLLSTINELAVKGGGR